MKFDLEKVLAPCALIAVVAATTLVCGCDAFSSIDIPAPDGFRGTSKEFPKAFEMMSKIISIDKRVPMVVSDFMVNDEDAEILRSGNDSPKMERYLVDIRDPADPYFSEAQFDQYVLHVRNQQPSAPSDELLRHLVDQSPDLIGPQGELASTLSIRDDTNLGIVVDQPHAIGNAYVMYVTVNGRSYRMVMVSESVWLRGHIVNLKVFSRLRDSGDVKWARDEAEAWASKATATNR